MVEAERRVPEPVTSIFGLGGEQRFRCEIARVTASAGVSTSWLDGLKPPLHGLVPYDCAVLARWDTATERYLPVLEDGDTEALTRYLRTSTAAAELQRLGFYRIAWPMVVHRVGVTLAGTSAWRDHLWPAGFRDGLGVGLFTENGRHVGFLSLLTYRSQVVTVTAAALLHGVNALLGSALECSPRDEQDGRPGPPG
ncbi:hypothetical protein GCM10009616_15470 [Microlunatus lacustris]